MAIDQQMAAEKAALELIHNNRTRGKRVRVMGIDVTPYIGARTPGFDSTRMLSNPEDILKDPKQGATYLWRDPSDTYTKSMVNRQIMRPVTMDRVDTSSPWANVNAVKILTTRGAREVVRTPGGLGLFEVPTMDAMKEADKALLPGKHWEESYLSDLAEQEDRFEADVEQLSAGSQGGRAAGSLVTKDTQSEMIV